MEKQPILSNNEMDFAETKDKIDFGFNGEKHHLGDAAYSCSSCDHPGIFQGYDFLDDISFNAPIQECFEELERLNGVDHTVKRVKKTRRSPLSPALLRLLNYYGRGLKRLTGAKRIKPSRGYVSIEARKRSNKGSGRLSVEETMRFAGEIFIQSYSQTLGGFSGSTHPYHISFSGISEQESKNVQLAEFLLAAADKISHQLYERASRLLDQCDYYSDEAGNPVERVIYYFSEALRERIDRETGKVGQGKKGSFNMEQALMTDMSAIASHEETPFPKIAQFSGVQAIIENVNEAKKIHIIDLGIRFGSQWSLLMEALAARSDFQIELLKITAVGTICKDTLEETGKRLMRLAESKNLPFCYKIVLVSDFLDLQAELLEVELDETVAVFSSYVLRSMLAIPDRLEHVMKIIATISPVVTVIIEADANHNSSAFENRFIEGLFYYSAYFDCLGECLSYDERNRRIIERVFFSEGIRNMVAVEGEERKIRNMKMEMWRAFIERYGPEEIDFSMSSLYQANLLLKERPKWSLCTLHMNGKSLVMCWKGVPMHFVSVWKFA